ncbi:nickel-dependent lactate racemase [Limisalsivibrio acetivorans]|uniref:nickel-dependent lactate racemase n=1 Tax=Limisalsivibrio acetivorans TaxID=1304888 RepID=UPI0003B4EDB8|nr:nickel-dependent lactate racemase [Limisalsivibrio acetivorans]
MKDISAQCPESADRIEIPWGKQKLSLNLDKKIDILAPSSMGGPLSDEGIIERMEKCIYSEGFTEMAASCERALFIVPDVTRKSGLERFIERMIGILEQAGRDYSFIFAIGTHRPMTEEEMSGVLTPEIYEKVKDRILPHDCEDMDMNDFYGISKGKTPVLINKAYREHDLIIPIGSVSYHYFAGYGGGRKLIFPGIAAKKSILRNHQLVLDPVARSRHKDCRNGNLRGNPVHDDIVDAVMISRAGHTFFSVNTILDDAGNIVEMVCGDLFMAHHKACEMLDERAVVSVPEKYDTLIVSCGGFPKDINMVQAQKSLDKAAAVAKDGADIYFFAQCPDGYGNSFFKDFFDHASASSMLESLFIEYQINRQTAFNLKSINEGCRVSLYSNFAEEDCLRMGFSHLASLEDIGISGKTAFLPSAYSGLFRSQG